ADCMRRIFTEAFRDVVAGEFAAAHLYRYWRTPCADPQRARAILTDGRHVCFFKTKCFRLIGEYAVAVAGQPLPRTYPYRPAAILINRIDVVGGKTVFLRIGGYDTVPQPVQPIAGADPDIAFAVRE